MFLLFSIGSLSAIWMNAQVPPVDIGSPAAIVGLAVNVGSFGVLVYVWLIQQPKFIKEIFDRDEAREERAQARFDAMLTGMTTKFEGLATSLVQNFHTEVELVRTRADARSDRMAERLSKTVEERFAWIMDEVRKRDRTGQ